MPNWLTAILVILGIVLVFVIYVSGLYNRLVTLANRYKNQTPWGL